MILSAAILFQSLLLQVSFKTSFPVPASRTVRVSIPSPSGLLQNTHRPEIRCQCVSIPSPSGLLQNNRIRRVYTTVGCFNPFSFRSPSKLFAPADIEQAQQCFNPFSFRSPSKHRGRRCGRITWFQSLLLQVSFKTITWRASRCARVSIPSPSGLLQNSQAPQHGGAMKFQTLLLQVSFKTRSSVLQPGGGVSIPSPSGLLQNPSRDRDQRAPHGFNPFSFRSPSKRIQSRCLW